MNIAILGYGKMGRTIERLALAQGDRIVLKVASNSIEKLTIENIQKADVAIEFSEPDSAFRNISFCLNNNIPVVCGTTAWLDKLDAAKELCAAQNGAFMYASNFSIGVNVFFELNRQLAKMMQSLSSYEIQLEEIHHTEKKDAPSGTAITLANDILAINNRKTNWVNTVSKQSSDLPIISKRLPRVPGTHLIQYKSYIDSLEIKHEAHSREGFAAGALLAARWLVGKNGFFEMKDLMKEINP